ncbi:hypothetical protein Aau02nite_21560 [Amorphoplanes auranticolor]|uniref:DUF58 domain-containing protein n=1 Tax=Actinoplanes auranticolor TaxID=47988 RepID=A0A919S6Y4_9ACTN|nr:hypothetical protein Aau02nite_21560 [Actinoplanes auranticolor]
MRPTRRGVTVLVAAALLTAYGWWGSYPLVTLLGVCGLAVVPAVLPLTGGRLRAEVTRTIEPDRVQRGRPARAVLRVRNAGRRHQGGFTAVDSIGATSRTVRVDSLRAGAEAVHEYALPTTARGRVTVGPLRLDRTDPLGLTRNRLTVGGAVTLVVHPRQLPVRPPSGGHVRHQQGGRLTDDAPGGSADLQDVREYVPGDEVRHLHWKATAHTGRLMVRDLADARESRLTVLLDTRAGVLSAGDFEEAVDLAASLLYAAARAGHPSQLVTPGGRVMPVHSAGPALRQFLDALSEIRADATPVTGLLLPPRTGRVVVITAAGIPPPPGRALVVLLGAGTSAPGSGRVIHAGDAADAIRRWNEAGW